MNKKFLIPALIAAVFAASAPALAQDRGHANQDRRDSGWQSERGRDNNMRDNDRGRDARRGNDYRRDDDRRASHDGRRDVRGNRGAGPRHDLHRGARLPAQYHTRQYVVDNWRSHRLSAPPRGHHWVQTGSDYVLVAVASGLIAQILLN
jgi:Ni/Co efflux regulator RcnB